MLSPVVLLCILWISAVVRAYIPATPTNDTEGAIQNGFNVTDVSTLSLLWYENGGNNTYILHVSYDLVGVGSTGISRGAFVYFSERNLTNDTTIAPWIALISCDSNSTDASATDDTFTLARDRGAVAALLYSTHSAVCMINKEYADPANFNPPFDVFSTQSLTTARSIEERFNHVDQDLYGNFNAQHLNESFNAINNTLNGGNSTSLGYMFATLRAHNATESSVPPASTPNTGGDGNNQPQGKLMGLGMVVLYCLVSNCL